MDYATLSLTEVRAGLDAIARETPAEFGGFDAQRLNWRPDTSRWSVGQCLEHLITANRLMFQAAEDAVNGTAPRTLWHRLPAWPRVLGRVMVRSQAPTSSRTFTAPPLARPAESDIAGDVVERFVEQHRNAVRRLQTLDERDAARTIMASPFIRVITYSVLDAWRLVFAHDRRHLEQARRVTRASGFPSSRTSAT